MSLRSTPLKEEHIALGAKMVDFAGWYMPVEYAGLRAEHLACRARVGLFDVSHMGEIRIKGPKALETVEWLTSNLAAKLNAGEAQYSLLTNADGGVVDDLIVYCVTKDTDYLLCVNASNVEKDFAWMLNNNKGADITNESDLWGQIAVQGPEAIKLATLVCGESIAQLKTFHFCRVPYGGDFLFVARTGYTGEDGVEIFVPAGRTVDLWRDLLDQGKPFGATPIGLGARDTLRTEMKYPLYGHEINDELNPLSAGLGWVIKPHDKRFIGRDKILAGEERALQQKLIGFKMVERGIARPGYTLLSEDGKRKVGFVTSGTPSPSLDENIGVGYLVRDLCATGTKICVEMRGRAVAAQVVATPFVKRKISI